MNLPKNDKKSPPPSKKKGWLKKLLDWIADGNRKAGGCHT